MKRCVLFLAGLLLIIQGKAQGLDLIVTQGQDSIVCYILSSSDSVLSISMRARFQWVEVVQPTSSLSRIQYGVIDERDYWFRDGTSQISGLKTGSGIPVGSSAFVPRPIRLRDYFSTDSTEGAKSRKLCMNGGLGYFSTWDGIEGLSLVYGAAWEDGPRIRKVRFGISQELELFAYTPLENCFSGSFLFGRQYSKSILKVYAAAGPGLMMGVKRGTLISSGIGWWEEDEYEKERFFTPGFTIESGVYFVPFKFLGFGVTGFSENGIYWSNYGFNLSLIAGDVR